MESNKQLNAQLISEDFTSYHQRNSNDFVKQVQWTDDGSRLIISTDSSKHRVYSWNGALRLETTLTECGPTYEFDTYHNDMLFTTSKD